MGNARPEAADEDVERVLFEGTGLSPVGVVWSGCEGMTETKLVGGGLMGVGGVVGCVLSACCIVRMFIAGSKADETLPVSCCVSVSDEDI